MKTAVARDKERCAWKRGSLFDIAFETAMGLKTHVPLVKKGNVSLRTFDEKGWRRINGVRSETRPSFFFFFLSLSFVDSIMKIEKSSFPSVQEKILLNSIPQKIAPRLKLFRND